MTTLRTYSLTATGLALVWLVRQGSFHWMLIRWAVVIGLTVLAVRFVETASRRTRGLVLLGAAVVALGAGFGITPPWLTKAGIHLTTLAGLVAVFAGLVLLVLGVRDVLPAGGRWKRWLTGIPVVLLTVLVVFSVSIAVAVTNVPRTDIDETPADRGITAADLELVTEDDVTLAAWYVPSENGAAVVLLHGAGSTRSSVLDEMQVLVDHGYGVLAYDARGHGDSGGRAMDFGWFGNWDTFPAIEWLSQSPDVEEGRIGLVGMSMGGEVAIGTAAFDRRVQAVVAEGATSRTAADNAWMPEEFGVQGTIQRWIDRLTYGLTDLFTETSPPIALRDAVTETAPRPVLLITASEVPDEGHAAEWIESGSPETVTVLEVDGAGHIGGLSTAPDLWTETVIGFLDREL